MSPVIPTIRVKITNRSKRDSVKADLQTQQTTLSGSAPSLLYSKAARDQKTPDSSSSPYTCHILTVSELGVRCPVACRHLLHHVAELHASGTQHRARSSHDWMGAMCALGAPRAPLSFTLLLSGPLARARPAGLASLKKLQGMRVIDRPGIGPTLRVSARQSSGRHACHAANNSCAEHRHHPR